MDNKSCQTFSLCPCEEERSKEEFSFDVTTKVIVSSPSSSIDLILTYNKVSIFDMAKELELNNKFKESKSDR